MNIEGPVLETLLAASRRGPPVLVFASQSYAAILANWAMHLRKACDAEAVVMALDPQTAVQAGALGLRSCAFAPVADLAELWVRRAEFFAALAGAGVSFIHSDADAVWLGDPRPFVGTTGADLAFSPGTVWPADIVELWGFVLCCGLFFVRAGPVTGDFFGQVAARARKEGDDQSAVNRTLADWGAQWVKPQPAGRRAVKGTPFEVFDQAVTGKAGGMKLALLPERLFPRLEDRDPGALVAHPLSPKSAAAKQAALARLGLWMEEGGR